MTDRTQTTVAPERFMKNDHVKIIDTRGRSGLDTSIVYTVRDTFEPDGMQYLYLCPGNIEVFAHRCVMVRIDQPNYLSITRAIVEGGNDD
jgi:hypothetical protein